MPATRKHRIAVQVVLGALPFFGMAFSVFWWDRATPVILGLPFNIAWLLAWILLAPAILLCLDRMRPPR